MLIVLSFLFSVFKFICLMCSPSNEQPAGTSSTKDLEEIYFDFRKQCFIYSKEKNTFCKLIYPTKETIGHYLKCSGHGSEAKVVAATEKWGRNVWVTILTFSSYVCICLRSMVVLFGTTKL